MSRVQDRFGALGETVFAPHRERVLSAVATVAGIMFVPLAAYHFARGNDAIATLLVFVLGMLAIDTIAIRLGRRPPIPFPLLLLPGALGVGLSLVTQGIYGAMWAYPMTLFAYFVLPRRRATVVASCFAGMVGALVFLELGRGVALRFTLSLVLCIVVLNIILGVLERLQAQLLSQSLTDPLTGAFNRRHMERCLEAAIERNHRAGAAASLILVDIDRFKSINDRFGHAAGDRALRAVVACIASRCRKSDQLFRMGGEEFVLLLPDTESLEAAGLAEELRRAIATTRILDKQVVTASMGVSQVRELDSVDSWLKRVDQALYEAKENGRDRVLTTSTRLPLRSLASV